MAGSQPDGALKVKVKVATPEELDEYALKTAEVPVPEVEAPPPVAKRDSGLTAHETLCPGTGFCKVKVLFVVQTGPGLVLPKLVIKGDLMVFVVLGLPLPPSQVLKRSSSVPPPAQEVKNLP